MARNLNFLLVKAHNYQINLIVPMQLGSICTTKITWFDITQGPSTERVIESSVCPKMNPEDTSIFSSEGIVLDDPKFILVIKPSPTENGKWTLDLISSKHDDIELHFSFQ